MPPIDGFTCMIIKRHIEKDAIRKRTRRHARFEAKIQQYKYEPGMDEGRMEQDIHLRCTHGPGRANDLTLQLLQSF